MSALLSLAGRTSSGHLEGPGVWGWVMFVVCGPHCRGYVSGRQGVWGLPCRAPPLQFCVLEASKVQVAGFSWGAAGISVPFLPPRPAVHLPPCTGVLVLLPLCRWVKQQSELAKQAQNPNQGPKLDLGFKEGQTIKLNIAVRSTSWLLMGGGEGSAAKILTQMAGWAQISEPSHGGHGSHKAEISH